MDDTISRAAAIDALADYIHNVDKVLGTGRLTAYDCKDAATSVFEELPSAQPLTAYVISDEDGNIKCSNCGSFECWGNYCMNCGAKMRGKNNE